MKLPTLIRRLFAPHPVKPVPLRYVVATKTESLRASQKRADVLCELAVYKATTTRAQRFAETEAAFLELKLGHAVAKALGQ